MHDKLKCKYANVTIAIVKNFVDSCLNCSLKKRALRTAANEQSNGGGQGFSKCGCNLACQNNGCKCLKKTKCFAIPDAMEKQQILDLLIITEMSK